MEELQKEEIFKLIKKVEFLEHEEVDRERGFYNGYIGDIKVTIGKLHGYPPNEVSISIRYLENGDYKNIYSFDTQDKDYYDLFINVIKEYKVQKEKRDKEQKERDEREAMERKGRALNLIRRVLS